MTTASGDNWRVTPGGSVQCDHAVLYAEARHRVLHSPRLSVFLPIILSGGYADDADHLRWVARGRVAEIERWARQIRSDSE